MPFFSSRRSKTSGRSKIRSPRDDELEIEFLTEELTMGSDIFSDSEYYSNSDSFPESGSDSDGCHYHYSHFRSPQTKHGKDKRRGQSKAPSIASSKKSSSSSRRGAQDSEGGKEMALQLYRQSGAMQPYHSERSTSKSLVQSRGSRNSARDSYNGGYFDQPVATRQPTAVAPPHAQGFHHGFSFSPNMGANMFASVPWMQNANTQTGTHFSEDEFRADGSYVKTQVSDFFMTNADPSHFFQLRRARPGERRHKYDSYKKCNYNTDDEFELT